MISLKDIANELHIEKGKFNKDTKYPVILQHLINGYRDMWYDVSGLPSYKIVDVDSNMSADIPPDMIKHIMIGVVTSSGEIQTLRENGRLAGNISTDSCGNPKSPTSQKLNYSPDYGGQFYNYSGAHYRNGEVIGRFYGLGGENTNGDYRIDKKAGKIYFSGNATTRQVVIMYLADISKINGSFMVHPWLRDPLKAYYRWMSLEAVQSAPLNAISFRQNRYVQEKRKAKKRFQSAHMSKILDINKKNISQSPKF